MGDVKTTEKEGGKNPVRFAAFYGPKKGRPGEEKPAGGEGAKDEDPYGAFIERVSSRR